MKSIFFLTPVLSGLIVSQSITAQPVINVIPGDQMRIDQDLSSVTANGSEWDVTLRIQDDNDDPSLPTSFRRWWHVEIANLDPGGETLNIELTNSGYSDFIVPVISTDGGATYTRVPTGPGFQNGFDFQIVTSGESAIRLAKYYPYTLSDYDAFRGTISGEANVVETVLGQSVQGRDIIMYTMTDSSVTDAGKQRVWIHSAVHPSENTAYFNCEGLILWLLDGSPEAEAVLDQVILNIVPMANPDGVALGNYRTNANSVNLENEWSFPYDSVQPEIVALRTQIENFMGEPGNPGSNPIKLLLNLHSTHGTTYPFHFVHQPNWPTNGVTAAVHALELRWVTALRNRSPYVDLGTDGSSTLSGRPFVESMMHDRYSLDPTWDDVMAITFEGVYQLGPISGVPNTPDDNRDVGAAMGLAIMDFFEITPTSTDLWLLY